MVCSEPPGHQFLSASSVDRMATGAAVAPPVGAVLVVAAPPTLVREPTGLSPQPTSWVPMVPDHPPPEWAAG